MGQRYTNEFRVNWLNNLSAYEPETAPHPAIYSNDTCRGRPLYSYAKAAGVTLGSGRKVACYHRSPKVDFSLPYGCCVGAAQTFGRWVWFPYPMQLNDLAKEIQVANLGYGAATAAFFHGIPEYIDLINGAQFVVVQVMSARCSTSQFQVVYGDRGRDLRTGERTKYDSFVRAAWESGEALQTSLELKERYLAEMLSLLAAIKVPKILVWISMRPPPAVLDSLSSSSIPPHLVDLSCVSRLRQEVTDYVEVTASPMHFRNYYASQYVHDIAAQRIMECLIRHELVRPKHQSELDLPQRSFRRGHVGRLTAVSSMWLLSRENRAKSDRIGHTPRRIPSSAFPSCDVPVFPNILPKRIHTNPSAHFWCIFCEIFKASSERCRAFFRSPNSK